MLWLVLLCVVTVGTSPHPGEDVTWLPLPQLLLPAQDSAEKGSSYTERLVQHWHSRLKTTTHRPPRRPVSSDKYHTFHSRLENATHRPPRTSSAPDDDINFHSRLGNVTHRPPRTSSVPSNRLSNHTFHSRLGTATHRPPRTSSVPSDRHSNHLFHSRLGTATHRPPRTSGLPSHRHSNHYVNLSTAVKDKPSRDVDTPVYKAWPGETPVESLDDLILYHTYTADKPNNYKLDSVTPTPASELLDRLVLFHAQTKADTTTQPSSDDEEPTYDLVDHRPATSGFKTSTTPRPAAAGDTKLSLDELILLHTHTTDDDPKPSHHKPHHPANHKPVYHYTHTEGSVQKPIGNPTTWDHHQKPIGNPTTWDHHHEKPSGHPTTWDHHHQKPSGHPTTWDHHEKPSGHPTTWDHHQKPSGHPTTWDHHEKPSGHPTTWDHHQKPSGHPTTWDNHQKPQRPNIILIEDVSPSYDHPPPSYQHPRPPKPSVQHLPAPQTVYTLLTHRPTEQPTTRTPPSHEAAQIVVINNHYPAHESTTPQRPHHTPTTPRPHHTTTRRPPYTVNLYPVPYPDDFTTRRPPLNVHTTHRPPSHVTIISPQSHYNTHRPSHVTSTTPQYQYPTHRPPQVTSTTPQYHYTTHKPPQVTVNIPQSHFTTHRPSHITFNTPQSHYTTQRPSYITVTTPESHYNTHRPSYVTATTPQPPYSTNRPSYVTITSPQSHYTPHPPLFVSSTTSQSDQPTYLTTTTPKPQTPRPPYVTTAIPSHPYYPTQASDKPAHVVVVCPNVTITSTINNYNTYTNATKEGCTDINIIINNENLLIKDPHAEEVSPPNIQGEPFPPQGDDPGVSGEVPDVSGEGPLDHYTPIVNRPWLPWDMIGIKGPLLDVLELLTLFWASLPTNIMVLLIVVGTIKKFAVGLALALAWWKYKQQKKTTKKSGGMEIHNTHLHLKGVREHGDDSHYHKTRRKYKHYKATTYGEDIEDGDEYEKRREDRVVYGNHREEYGDALGGGGYENHRGVYGGALADREEYDVDPRTPGGGGDTRMEDYEDALGGGRDGEYDEGGGEEEEYDPLAGARRMDGGREEEMEYLDTLEVFVRGLIDAFQVMPDEGEIVVER